MKTIRFSRGFLPAAVFSGFLVLLGLAGYLVRGFNLGVDFQAGLLQEVQIAPPAFGLRYAGLGNVSVSMERTGLSLVLTGAAVENNTFVFNYTEYRSAGALAAAMREAVSGLEVRLSAPESTPSTLLVQSAQGNPSLGPGEDYTVHYLPSGLEPVPIEDVRAALGDLGGVSVQILGQSQERRFMIRLDQEGEGNDTEAVAASATGIMTALEAAFGENGVAITRSDFVNSRFSKVLANQAIILLGLTLLLILIYASVRFKPQFAAGAVLAIAHDALVMVAFITWTRMEFNTTTIAAILTILGYSINDTIVIFDRIRENRRIEPDRAFVDILDISITESLSRTIITTVTTMLAVVSLYVFTTRALFQADLPFAERVLAVFTEHGSMKDFAMALLVGMVSGVYSTIYIASGIAHFWENARAKRLKKAPAVPPGTLPAKA